MVLTTESCKKFIVTCTEQNYEMQHTVTASFLFHMLENMHLYTSWKPKKRSSLFKHNLQ